MQVSASKKFLVPLKLSPTCSLYVVGAFSKVHLLGDEQRFCISFQFSLSSRISSSHLIPKTQTHTSSWNTFANSPSAVVVTIAKMFPALFWDLRDDRALRLATNFLCNFFLSQGGNFSRDSRSRPPLYGAWKKGERHSKKRTNNYTFAVVILAFFMTLPVTHFIRRISANSASFGIPC